MESSPSAPRWRVAAFAGGIALESAGLLSLLGADGATPGRLLLALGLAVGGFALAMASCRGRQVTLVAALLAAAALRLAALPVPPQLSNDLWRYLWDGRVAAHGIDPYRVAPDDAAVAHLRDRGWEQLDHRAIPTVYPPLALTGFSIAARSPWPAATWKLLVAAVDLGACALLLRLALLHGIPLRRAGLYAWNPLPALEIAGMGHVDGLAVAAALGAVLLLARRRPLAAGVAAAAGILAKLGPLAALPMWARQGGRPGRFLLAALGLTAIALTPVIARGVPSGLITYAAHWEHAAPLHEPLWRLLAWLDADGGAQALVAATEQALARPTLLDGLYPHLYPQRLARVLLLLAAAAVVLRSLACADRLRGPLWLFGGLLLCSATVHPWYLLWVLPWAALAGSASWIWASLAAPLLYLPQLDGPPLWPALWAVVWIPTLVLWLRERPWTTA